MQVIQPAQEADPALISLVFPVYNGATLVQNTWHQVRTFLRESPDNWEILFVCDGCTDDTESTLRRLTQEQGDQVRVLSYEQNRGKGYAVRHGLLAARGAYRLFTDVDLAYGFEDISRLAKRLQTGAEVAIASRHHPESRLVLPPRLQGYFYRRHLQSLVFSWLVRRLLPLALGDTQAGLKGLSARAAELVLPHLRCRGFGFDCELLTACVRFGLEIAEVPVCVRYSDRATTTTFRSSGRMIQELWKIRRRWMHFTPPEPGENGVLFPACATPAVAGTFRAENVI